MTNPKPKIDVEMDLDSDFPIILTFDEFSFYLSESDADKVVLLLVSALQEIEQSTPKF